MQVFRGELLCEIRGIQRINNKECEFKLNPSIPGLTLTIPQKAAQEWLENNGKNTLYLSVSSYHPDVEDIKALKHYKRSIWPGIVYEEDGKRISITGNILSSRKFPMIHKEIGYLWEKIIRRTADFFENRGLANDYIKRYLLCSLKQEPLNFHDRRNRTGVSSLKSAAYAIQMRASQIETMDLDIPDTDDLEDWLRLHAVTALQKKVVFLRKKDQLAFDIQKLEHAYFEI